MTPDKLIHMANQIAAFFASQPREDAAARTAGHLRDFWDPAMREQLIAAAAGGAEGIDPVARAAVDRLRAG